MKKERKCGNMSKIVIKNLKIVKSKVKVEKMERQAGEQREM